jgi:hypothetical protein
MRRAKKEKLSLAENIYYYKLKQSIQSDKHAKSRLKYHWSAPVTVGKLSILDFGHSTTARATERLLHCTVVFFFSYEHL